MNKQPEALWIAGKLEDRKTLLDSKAAAELRRLHEVEQQRDELLGALRKIRGAENRRAMSAIADAAIAKATGEQA